MTFAIFNNFSSFFIDLQVVFITGINKVQQNFTRASTDHV